MKKVVLLCTVCALLSAACTTPGKRTAWGAASFLSPRKPVLILGGQTFHLTRAYPVYNATVNIYQTDSLPRKTIQITAQPPSEESKAVYEATFQMMNVLAQNLPEKTPFSSANNKDSFTVSSVGENNSYRYLRSEKTPKNYTNLLFTGLPLDENFAQTDNKWRPQLDALKIPRIYPVRPGEKKPDDSEELEKIKQLLSAPYNPQMQMIKNKNMTVVRSIDPNQKEAFELISKGNEPDAAAWLKEHLAEYSPVYLYAFAARQAARAAPYRDFLFWFFAASLRGGADAALCKDKYAGQYLIGLKYQMADIVQSAYSDEPKDMTPAQMESVIREVVQWDARYPQKNSPDWICQSGHAVWTSEAYPQTEWKTRRKEFKEKYTASAFRN